MATLYLPMKYVAAALSTVIDKEVTNQDIHSFSQSIAAGHRAGLIADTTADLVSLNSRKLNEAVETDRERLSHDVFSEQYLIKRPLLQALEPDTAGAPVLLIDELDRADEPFDAFLLEVLAENQITIPEFGTVKAEAPPITIITSNRTREIHDALKRRCFYHWVDYPDAARELEILRRKAHEPPPPCLLTKTCPQG